MTFLVEVTPLSHKGISSNAYDMWDDLTRLNANISVAQLIEASPIIKTRIGRRFNRRHGSSMLSCRWRKCGKYHAMVDYGETRVKA